MPAIALLVLLLTSLAPEVLAVTTSTTNASTTKPPTCLEGGTSDSSVPPRVSVAIVKPIFTSTPYSQYMYGSFYAFYKKYHASAGNITTDLNWLNTSVKSGMTFESGWGHSFPLYSFLASPAARNCGLVLGKNLLVVTDINVTQGALFNSDGSRRFDAIVIGHEEYVTQAEYDQFRLFVASGGGLIDMSANAFYARVSYNPTSMFETFVMGHGGYAFNGHTAWHTKAAPFTRNSSGWFGSFYCCFLRFKFNGAVVNGSNLIGGMLEKYFGSTVFPYYSSHEENAIGNFTQTSIVATFVRQSGLVVASYIHRYGRGAVFCLCVFGEDIVNYDPSIQLFLVASVAASLTGGGVLPTQPQGIYLTLLPIAAAAGLTTAAFVVIVLRRHRKEVRRTR